MSIVDSCPHRASEMWCVLCNPQYAAAVGAARPAAVTTLQPGAAIFAVTRAPATERALRRLVAALTAGNAAERRAPDRPLPRHIEREVTAAYNEACDVIEDLDALSVMRKDGAGDSGAG